MSTNAQIQPVRRVGFLVYDGMAASDILWEIDDLADLAGMSPRNFARRFVERTGTTPAKLVEMMRAERARQLIETTTLPLVRVAERSGLRDEQSLRRALVKAFGKTPSAPRSGSTHEI